MKIDPEAMYLRERTRLAEDLKRKLAEDSGSDFAVRSERSRARRPGLKPPLLRPVGGSPKPWLGGPPPSQGSGPSLGAQRK